MDAQAVLDEFMASEHGQNAVNELAGRGLTPDQVNQVLHEAVGGRLSESLAGKLGLDAFTALGIVAAVTPFLTSFLGRKVAR